MNIIACPNGHYFNKDKYKVCPICAAPVMTVISPSQTENPVQLIDTSSTEQTTAATITDTSYRSKGD